MIGVCNPNYIKSKFEIGLFLMQENKTNVKRVKIGTYAVVISVAGESRQSR